MNQLELMLSRELQSILTRIEKDIERRTGSKQIGIGLVLFPFAHESTGLKEGDITNFQYASNAPRTHMHESLRIIVAKWDADKGTDTPLHERQ